MSPGLLVFLKFLRPPPVAQQKPNASKRTLSSVTRPRFLHCPAGSAHRTAHTLLAKQTRPTQLTHNTHPATWLTREEAWIWHGFDLQSYG